jgi:hypothetical protein
VIDQPPLVKPLRGGRHRSWTRTRALSGALVPQ